MRTSQFYRHAIGRMPTGSALFGGPRSRRPAYRTTLGPRGRTLGALGALGDAQTAWSSGVEQWRALLQKYAGGIPIDFLMAWITRESAGNPCSYTTLHESGIFQLMPPDNTNRGGTSEGALRTACVGTTQQASRALTDAEADEQVRSGLQYVNYARGLAHSVVDWGEDDPDFWRMVKMVHVAPARVLQFGAGSTDWGDFVSRAAATTPSSWTNNADWVGAYGVGGGGVGSVAADAVASVRGLGPAGWLAIGGIALAGALVYRQRKHGGRLLAV